MVGQPDFRGLDKSLRIQRIVDTATELFHKKGYRATTLDDVSKKLGITKAALYHYVSSKEKLLSVIYIQALENIFRNVDKILEGDLPPNEKLRLIIRNHIQDIIIRSLPMFSVFFSEESQLPKQEFQKIRKEKEKYTRIIEEIIAEGISQGVFKAVDPRLQAYAILGMCNWVYKWYKAGEGYYTPEAIAEHFVSILEKGYLKDHRREKQTQVGKDAPQGRKEIHRQLKSQCGILSDLIDQLER
jgi:AcrR family transcriptional regulator